MADSPRHSLLREFYPAGAIEEVKETETQHETRDAPAVSLPCSGAQENPKENEPPQRTQKVLLGDCLAHMRAMSDSSFDVVVTSPPYNIGIKYASYVDKLPREAYLAWLADVGREFLRLMRSDASLFLNVGSTSCDPWIEYDVARVFRELGFTLQNNIVWVKSISIRDDTYGHFKPVNSDRFLNHTHEAIFHFTKRGRTKLDRLAAGVPYKDKSNVKRFGDKGRPDRRCAGNSWFIPYETNASKAFAHPAGFPVELPLRCLKLHGGAGLDVLDPFLGSGSTLVAAKRLGHAAVGIDIDPSYVSMALTRTEQS